MKCECEKTDYHPFVMGGHPYQTKRCSKEATFRVFGKTAEEKKQPPMLLCDECYGQFKRRNRGYKVEKISEKSSSEGV